MTSTRLQSKCDPITDVTFASPVLYSSDHAAVCTVITHACSYVPCGRLKMLLADPTHSYHIHMETSVRKYLRKWVECNGDQMQKGISSLLIDYSAACSHIFEALSIGLGFEP
jgi:hypothetical protein